MLTTLVVQGLTLGWLIERVGMRGDGVVQREIGIARAETARAALQALESETSPASLILRQEYDARLRSGQHQSSGSPGSRQAGSESLQRRLIAAQRHALIDLRARMIIGDAAFQAAEQELDLLELTADPRIRPM